MRICLDLDLTLVNIFPLWQEAWIDELARRLELDAQYVFTAGARIWEQGRLYSLRAHLHELLVDTQLPWVAALQEEFSARVRAGEANYDDTKVFLDALAIAGRERSILTFGDEGYQSMKIEGLRRTPGFFHSVHFTKSPGEKADVLAAHTRSWESVVFIDDNPREHERVAMVAPHVRRIQIRRTKDIAVSQHAHAVVSNLREAWEAIA